MKSESLKLNLNLKLKEKLKVSQPSLVSGGRGSDLMQTQ